MPGDKAVRLTLKTVIGDYTVTLKLEDAREVLIRYAPLFRRDLEPKQVSDYLSTIWLSNAMKADSGVAGTEHAPYLNYQVDSGERVSLRSTALMAVESRLISVSTRMGFGSLDASPDEPQGAK
jgi:hypothetical protein